MKSTKFLKNNALELSFLALIITCFFIYFVVYLTPSRIAWYREMRNQIIVFYHLVTRTGQ